MIRKCRCLSVWWGKDQWVSRLFNSFMRRSFSKLLISRLHWGSAICSEKQFLWGEKSCTMRWKRVWVFCNIAHFHWIFLIEPQEHCWLSVQWGNWSARDKLSPNHPWQSCHCPVYYSTSIPSRDCRWKPFSAPFLPALLATNQNNLHYRDRL